MIKILLSGAAASLAMTMALAHAAPVSVEYRQKISASDGDRGDVFGSALALSADHLVVGASLDDDGANGAGSAYIFRLDGTEVAKLTAEDPAFVDRFGNAVAISGDDVLVGSFQDDDNGGSSGSVFHYGTDGSLKRKLITSDGGTNDTFGNSVAIADGRLLGGAPAAPVVGQNSAGAVYSYDMTGGDEIKIVADDLTPDNRRFGAAIAATDDKLIIGARADGGDFDQNGAAYLTNSDGSGSIKLTASDGADRDLFGEAVGISNSWVIIGARGDDSEDGTQANSGAAYIFDHRGNEIRKLTASDGAAGDFFGGAVAISEKYAVIGASEDDDRGRSSGSVYVFDIITGEQIAKLTAPDGGQFHEFGLAVAIFGDVIAIGADQASGRVGRSGAVYLFDIVEGSPVPLPAAGLSFLVGLGLLAKRRT